MTAHKSFDSIEPACQYGLMDGQVKHQSIRGMNDIGGDEIHLWRYLETLIRELYEGFGFHEVRTPLLEATALFKRGVGDTSDIVEKEMYTFEDRNGDSLSLRPEGTASIARALIQHNWLRDSPCLKIYYFGPMFRHERPQKGRYRQHYQFGLEIFGVPGAQADAEIISLQQALFEKLGIQDLTLRISTIGCQICRPPYKQKLINLLQPKVAELCTDCQRRMSKNPLRIFDCKSESCQKLSGTLPTQFEHLCEDCHQHFDQLKTNLDLLKISYQVDPKIVRGIDYYTRTAFEFVSSQIGAQGTVCGGGRYDGLIETLGGKSTPGVGCGMGVERLILLTQELIGDVTPEWDLAIICADEAGRDLAQKTTFDLRTAGFRVELDLLSRSLKAQMKRANKIKVPRVVIIGQAEVDSGKLVLKDMKSSEQSKIDFVSLIKVLEQAKVSQ